MLIVQKQRGRSGADSGPFRRACEDRPMHSKLHRGPAPSKARFPRSAPGSEFQDTCFLQSRSLPHIFLTIENDTALPRKWCGPVKPLENLKSHERRRPYNRLFPKPSCESRAERHHCRKRECRRTCLVQIPKSTFLQSLVQNTNSASQMNRPELQPWCSRASGDSVLPHWLGDTLGANLLKQN
jgi:hypothetical protein